MTRLRLDRLLTAASALIAILAVFLGRSSDIEIAATALLATLVDKV